MVEFEIVLSQYADFKIKKRIVYSILTVVISGLASMWSIGAGVFMLVLTVVLALQSDKSEFNRICDSWHKLGRNCYGHKRSDVLTEIIANWKGPVCRIKNIDNKYYIITCNNGVDVKIEFDGRRCTKYKLVPLFNRLPLKQRISVKDKEKYDLALESMYLVSSILEK